MGTENGTAIDPAEAAGHPSTSPTGRSRVATVARWTIPFLVSGALLAWILSSMDVAVVFDRVTPAVAVAFFPPLLIFIAAALAIEAVSLVWVVSESAPFSSIVTAARIKAASYLLGIVNYALGAGALTVLLRRRARIPLAEAAGSVFVIGLFDLGSLVAFVIVGLGLMGTDTPGVQAGIVALAGAAILAGFTFLRAPISMGPLDPLRELTLFRAARTLPIPLLARLALLRALFVSGFVALMYTTLAAFDVRVPLLALIVNTCVMLLVAVLPIAAAGLGTGQIVFVALFERWAPPETLLAASLLLSFGMITTRSALGLVFAREFAREALAHRDEANQ